MSSPTLLTKVHARLTLLRVYRWRRCLSNPSCSQRFEGQSEQHRCPSPGHSLLGRRLRLRQGEGEGQVPSVRRRLRPRQSVLSRTARYAPPPSPLETFSHLTGCVAFGTDDEQRSKPSRIIFAFAKSSSEPLEPAWVSGMLWRNLASLSTIRILM
jgi:hypothetical protein